MLQTSIGKQLYTEFQKVLWHLPAEQPPTASQHLTTWQGGGELWIPGANFAPTLLPPSATSSPIAKWLWTKEDLPSDTTWSFSTLSKLLLPRAGRPDLPFRPRGLESWRRLHPSRDCCDFSEARPCDSG